MDSDLLISFLAAAVRVATPLLLAALGEAISERAGIINLGVEGTMLVGALAATLGATAAGPWAGACAAVAGGLVLASIFGAFSVLARADQIITGTAITLAAVGLTGAVYRQAYGAAGVGLGVPTFAGVSVPVLSRIPWLGPPLFVQSVLTYVGYAAVPLLWWLVFRTRWGLELRATGESSPKAAAAGVQVRRVRFLAVLIGGGFAGLAGGSLVLAQVGTFAERMTAGRGFIAIAIVVLGGWHPVRVAGAALFFGAAMALQFLFQSLQTGIPYQLFLALPYLLTLLVLAGSMSTRAPAGLGR